LEDDTHYLKITEVVMNLQMEKYLKATPIIDCDNPLIKEKAEALTKKRKDIIDKARALFYFVRDEIKYNMYAPKSLPEHFQASSTLSRGEGYCVQKAVLLAALARAAGIPSGLGFARIRNNILPEKTQKWLGTNIFPFHGFGELYIDGKWVKATPAFDLKMCERNRIVPVEFDGKNDAVLHSHSRDGELHIEYLKYIGRYDDLPLDQLRDVVIKHFGSRFDEPPRRTNKGE
jgi:transglutaminase-like putative cysteine protease